MQYGYEKKDHMTKRSSISVLGSILLIGSAGWLGLMNIGTSSNAAETSAAKPQQAMFKTKAEAEAAAADFGCHGAHQMGSMWMVCDAHGSHQPTHQHNP